jgi:rfaE bifunctional protein kinase chain/domain
MDLFKNKKILIIGDLMLDSYLFGEVNRISPEAPVPIVNIKNKINKLGGSANVASNIKNIGGTPILCSVIGDDLNGDILISILQEMKISTDNIYKSKNRKTTNKTRIIGNNHQMLRIDDEECLELNKDENTLLSIINNTLDNNNIDCILFEDYDKGILNDYIINIITNRANNLNIPIIVDPKRKNFNSYNNITLFKPNLKEFKESINIHSNDRDELLKNGSKILHKRGIEIVFVTLSEDGIFISYKKGTKTINKIIPGTARNIVDVSGAGDTVISIISILINDISIEEIAKISNLAGGIVCEEIGAVPINKEKLLKEYYDTKN